MLAPLMMNRRFGDGPLLAKAGRLFFSRQPQLRSMARAERATAARISARVVYDDYSNLELDLNENIRTTGFDEPKRIIFSKQTKDIKETEIELCVPEGQPLHTLLLRAASALDKPCLANAVVHGDAGDSGKNVQWCRTMTLGQVVEDSQTCNPALRVFMRDAKDNAKEIPVHVPAKEDILSSLERGISVLRAELADLERVKRECDARSARAANGALLGGLAALCTQWGVMARLTWWDYSWDVMEPIAYFMTFGTGIAAYVYFVVTRRDFSTENFANLVLTRKQRKNYARANFDLERYTLLLRRIAIRETLASKIRLRTKLNGAAGQSPIE